MSNDDWAAFRQQRLINETNRQANELATYNREMAEQKRIAFCKKNFGSNLRREFNKNASEMSDAYGEAAWELYDSFLKRYNYIKSTEPDFITRFLNKIFDESKTHQAYQRTSRELSFLYGDTKDRFCEIAPEPLRQSLRAMPQDDFYSRMWSAWSRLSQEYVP